MRQRLSIREHFWRGNARASAPVAAASPVTAVAAASDAPPGETRDIFDARQGAFVPSAIVDRTTLSVGQRVSGPAAIVERETTTIVTSSFDAIMQPDGCILLRAKAA